MNLLGQFWPQAKSIYGAKRPLVTIGDACSARAFMFRNLPLVESESFGYCLLQFLIDGANAYD